MAPSQGESEGPDVTGAGLLQPSFQSPKSGVRHPKIGVEKEKPGSPEAPGSGIHLAASPPGCPHHQGSGLPSQLTGFVGGAAVGHQDPMRDVQPGKILQEFREGFRFIKGGDDDPQRYRRRWRHHSGRGGLRRRRVLSFLSR